MEYQEPPAIIAQRIAAVTMELEQRVERALGQRTVIGNRPLEETPEIVLNMIHHGPAGVGLELPGWRWLEEKGSDERGDTGSRPKRRLHASFEGRGALDSVVDRGGDGAELGPPGLIMNPRVSPRVQLVSTLRGAIEDVQGTLEPSELRGTGWGQFGSQGPQVSQVPVDQIGCGSAVPGISVDWKPFKTLNKSKDLLKGSGGRTVCGCVQSLQRNGHVRRILVEGHCCCLTNRA